ncbi:MAG: (d)CMP kinase [Actinobacteria bacterium]|nr:(d)CMP kinase [Actinomycetota bacterium]
MIIAVDGPAGSGKSSVCRGTAHSLGWRYLDTGAMYRAMTWAVLEAGIDPSNANEVANFCTQPKILSGFDPQMPTIVVDGIDVSKAIRLEKVTSAVSAVSAISDVRTLLVLMQRQEAQQALSDGTGIVVEGRDITTVVLPDAEVKIFLTARPEIRALRRAKEEAGSASATVKDIQATREALQRRDHLDSTRKASPLTQSKEAFEIDTSDMTLDEVIAEVVVRAEAAQ